MRWLLLLFALPLHAQRIAITASALSLAAYDTVSAAAVPYTAANRKSGTSKILWRANPAGALTFVLKDRYGHTVSIVAEIQGPAYAVATWARTDRSVIRDSVSLTVGPPAHAVQGFNTLIGGAPALDLLLLPTWCVYPLETDRRGTVYTGRAWTWATEDTLLARVLNSSRCPDTSSVPSLVTFAKAIP